tara:strand:+ start:292 stop:705 length:414 start_codon:yes stop_codon:yes gene_type:complete
MTRINELRQRLAGRWDKKNGKESFKLPHEYIEKRDRDRTEMHKKWAEGKYSDIHDGSEIPPYKDTGNVFKDQVGPRGQRSIPPSRLPSGGDNEFQFSMSSGAHPKYPKEMTKGFTREYIEKEKLAILKQRLARLYES